jgi:hypothetical protein
MSLIPLTLSLPLSRPLGFAHDHSHCPVLAPATLAALPSTRAIETRSLPTSLAATHRGFAFYVAFPESSIPDRDVFYVAASQHAPFAPFSSGFRFCTATMSLSVQSWTVRSAARYR